MLEDFNLEKLIDERFESDFQGYFVKAKNKIMTCIQEEKVAALIDHPTGIIETAKTSTRIKIDALCSKLQFLDASSVSEENIEMVRFKKN